MNVKPVHIQPSLSDAVHKAWGVLDKAIGPRDDPEALLAQYLDRITTLQARVKQLENEP